MALSRAFSTLFVVFIYTRLGERSESTKIHKTLKAVKAFANRQHLLTFVEHFHFPAHKRLTLTKDRFHILTDLKRPSDWMLLSIFQCSKPHNKIQISHRMFIFFSIATRAKQPPVASVAYKWNGPVRTFYILPRRCQHSKLPAHYLKGALK